MTRLLRPGSTLASALILTALGCQASPVPAQTASTQGMPQRTATIVAPSASPAASPTGLAEPLSSPSSPADTADDTVPVALASASVDTDLPQDDETAIESLVDSDEVKAYLPATLIHDGGVILYQLLGAGLAPMEAVASDAAGRKACAGPAAPPDAWSRSTTAIGKHQLRVRRVPGTKDQATVKVTWQDSGTLDYRSTSQSGRTRKRIVEDNVRSLQLQRTGSSWHVTGLTPIAVTSDGGHAGLDLQQVRIYHGQDTKPTLDFDEQAPMLPLGSGELLAAPGDTLRVEVEVTDKKACPIFVFAHLVGGASHTRQRLLDDGTQGDVSSGDGVYSGLFVVPATQGLYHIAVDTLLPSSFQSGGVYRANGLGMSFTVHGEAAPARPSATASP